ncbi:hypothetical protein SPRG_20513 [Saprolegnia parasitica CBS 223.65]|uniref:RING-type domain-containing protein n=1 Tax=Saprolegnia parasitica (strain CBS 223.65) TaxID=695850 RepID=A0A067C7K1_SAPPC|nr:hypothetical protein SPRG_20513 [Saprolegnia parasitica CBS 223.65]KDO26714.1 hypothetical protein SPRG_20513 [Saprolegnia parasitica CBS 223.65]|eukprot:XP_012202599.1 hypothetical protein SPRG_20513 [Saprolegnia parasitica CBS 223.65]
MPSKHTLHVKRQEPTHDALVKCPASLAKTPRVYSLGAQKITTRTKGNLAGADAYMSYRFVVVCPRKKSWWIFDRRYSDFYALRALLRDLPTTKEPMLSAPLPRRRLAFAVDNRRIVDERSEGLARFTADVARLLAPDDRKNGDVGQLVGNFLCAPRRAEALRKPCSITHDCPICLEETAMGDRSLTTACGHSFHEACLVKWLETEASCPLCRASALHGTLG